MFPETPSLPKPLNVLLCVLTLLTGSMTASGQEGGRDQETAQIRPDTARLRIEPLPSEFEEWRDLAGFSWQLTRQGALQSGDVPYLQNGMALFVGGGAFSPEEGDRLHESPPEETRTRIELRGKVGETAVTRDVLFDAKRGGIRILDLFSNQGKTPASNRVEYKSSYHSPWQDLHGTEGRILSPNPGAGMGSRDFGVVVKFSASEGRQDTLFLTSAQRGAQRPNIVYSSNLRELSLVYDLTIPPGTSVALLHWVVQRNLRSPVDAEQALRPFYQRRRLIDPVVEEETIPLVANFDEAAFPEPGGQPFNLEALASLNELLTGLDVDRGDKDLLWISPENQLTGEINREASLTVRTGFGERKTGIDQVAAVLGGGARGWQPRVFLRDGRVWSGPLFAEKLTFKIEEGWDVEELAPDQLPILLLRLDPRDGRPPEGAGLFVAARSGDVFAVQTGGQTGGWEVLSPWGSDTVPLAELQSLRYTRWTGPKFRLCRRDGSRLTVFLGGETIRLEPAGGGEPVTLEPDQILGAWRPDAGDLSSSCDLEEEWFDFEDIGSGKSLPGFAALLKGNNLLQGKLAMESLHLISGSTVTPLNPAEILSIRRSFEGDTETAPSFEIELRGGEILSGRLRERAVFIESNGRVWQAPIQHFLAYRGD